MIDVVPTTKLHTVQLGCTMRRADVDECTALGLGTIEAAFDSWRASDYCSSLLVGGEVAAIGGLVMEAPASALSMRTGIAWLLTAQPVERAPMALHRTAKAWLRGIRAHADRVWNHVDARHTVSLRWLEALGFRIHAARPHGPLGQPFHLVTRELT